MNRGWIVAVALLVAAVGTADDWSSWRGPSANGISSETGWDLSKAKLSWAKELGVGYSSFCVQDNRLYTMGNVDGEDVVYCFEAQTGQEFWRYSYKCKPGKYKGPRSTPVLDGPNLYTVSREGLVHCLDAESGEVKWKRNTLILKFSRNIAWGIASSAVIEGDLLLLNIGDSGVAIDKNSGKIQWKSRGKSSYASPVLFTHADRRLAALFSAEHLYIVEAETGKVVDSVEWKTKYDVNGADPLWLDGRIFISSGYDRGCAMFDFSSGKLEKLWENNLMRNHFSSSVYIDGYIYGVDGNHNKKGFLRCIKADDGTDVWSEKIGFGSLMAADGKLIVLDDRGSLSAVEITPKGYKELDRFETGLKRVCWTPPVLANGMIYCRNDKGTMVAVDVGK